MIVQLYIIERTRIKVATLFLCRFSFDLKLFVCLFCTIPTIVLASFSVIEINTISLSRSKEMWCWVDRLAYLLPEQAVADPVVLGRGGEIVQKRSREDWSAAGRGKSVVRGYSLPMGVGSGEWLCSIALRLPTPEKLKLGQFIKG